MDEILYLAQTSRDFFILHKVYRYRMKKVIEMSDREEIQKCHWYVEENNLVEEWLCFQNGKKKTRVRLCER